MHVSLRAYRLRDLNFLLFRTFIFISKFTVNGAYHLRIFLFIKWVQIYFTFSDSVIYLDKNWVFLFCLLWYLIFRNRFSEINGSRICLLLDNWFFYLIHLSRNLSLNIAVLFWKCSSFAEGIQGYLSDGSLKNLLFISSTHSNI